MGRSYRTAIFLCCLIGAACSGSDPVSPPVPGTATIGPDGGTVSLDDVVEVTIPAGALSSPVTISITRTSTPARLAAEGAFGQAFRLQPEGQPFSVPVEIAIFVSDADLEETSLDMLTLLSTGDGSAEVEALSNVRTEPGSGGVWIRASTTHFSIVSPAVLEPNRPPTIDLGEDRTVGVGDPVDLDAEISDPDDDPLTVTWSFESRPDGSGATFSSSSGVSTSFTPDVAGEYRVRATVSDDRGETAATLLTIVASDPPTADAGDDRSVGVGATVSLDGRRSTGSNLSYEWSFLSTPSGSNPTINDANQPVASFTAGTAGDYVVELIVSDGSRTARDTVRITAVQNNRSPTVSLSGPAAVLLGSTATVDATASDPDGDAITLTWSLQTPVGSSSALTTSGSSASFTPDVPGQYVVRATASDGTTTAQAGAEVFGNVDVAGTYDTTFEVLSASGCQGLIQPDQTTGDMPVQQPSPGQVVLDLPAVSPNIKSKPTGSLQGTFYFFNGTILVGNDDSQTNANGTFRGTMDGTTVDLTFRFTALTCTVEGTVKGTKI